MPIYEYWCSHCERRVAIYHQVSPPTSLTCPQCGGSELNRLFSTFSVRKTDKDIYESILSDSQLTRGMLEDNPKALAEWNKQMSRGEKVTPEYEEMVERMEMGEIPTKPGGESTGEPGLDAE